MKPRQPAACHARRKGANSGRAILEDESRVCRLRASVPPSTSFAIKEVFFSPWRGLATRLHALSSVPMRGFFFCEIRGRIGVDGTRLSFDRLEHKLAEAQFFLCKATTSGVPLFEAWCYVSAFAAATHGVTSLLAAELGHIPGFEAWYEARLGLLRQSPFARYLGVPVGEAAANPTGRDHPRLYRDPRGALIVRPAPMDAADGRLDTVTGTVELDVVAAAREHLRAVSLLIAECFRAFGSREGIVALAERSYVHIA